MKKLFFITSMFLTINTSAFAALTPEERIQELEEQVKTLTGENEVLKHNLKLAEKEAAMTPVADKTEEQIPAEEAQPKEEKKPAAKNLNLVSGSMAMEDYNAIQGTLQNGDYVKAEKMLKAFIKNHSDSTLIINAKYWLGETYFHRKDYGKAATEFGEAYGSYSSSDKKNAHKGPEILFKLAKSFHNLGKKDEAKVTLMQFEKEFKIVAPNLRNEVDAFKKEIGV